MLFLNILCAILCAVLGLFMIYILFLFVCSLLVDQTKEYENDSPFYRAVLHGSTAVALFILRVKVHTVGMEKVPTDIKPLFAGNHRSNYDPLIEWQVFRKWDPSFVSKKANFRVPFFGQIIRRCCFLPIDRKNPRNAINTINKAAKLLERQEVSIGIYPEGTRSKSDKLLPFHKGVFKIAQKSKRPIVVMAIAGTERIYRRAPFRRSDVTITIADVIPAENVVQMSTEEISERVRAALENALKEKKNEQDLHTV